MELFTYATPESVGISSADVLRMINVFEERQRYMHGFLVLCGNAIIAEGYWKPFHKDFLHRMYSVSKSFVGMAVGMLCDDGKITLDDHVVDYFPDKLPAVVHPYIADMTIRDLLRMEACYAAGATYGVKDKDWAWTFFNTEPDHPSGTIFNYDTSASYVLGVLVERVTGKPFLEYMKDKGLREAGFSENAWCVKSPEGNSWGGSGVMCTLRDLARVTMMMRDYGKLGGKQVLSEGYARDATSPLVNNNNSGHPGGSHYGYGYQIWQGYDGAFSFRGMGGQVAYCLRDKGLILVTYADTQGNASTYREIDHAFVDYIGRKKADHPLPEDPAAQKALADKIASLDYPYMYGRTHTPCAERIGGKRFVLNPNPMGIKWLEFTFDKDGGTLHYENAQGEKTLPFGMGKYLDTTFPQDGYFGDTIGKDGGRRYRCLASAGWVEDEKLMLKADIIDDYFGNVTMTFGFKGSEIGINMEKTAEWFLNEYTGFTGGKMA